MTKKEIYEHLANVYLGKSVSAQRRNKRRLNRKILWNILILFVISVGAFYGLTAFLIPRNNDTQNSIIFALNNNPIRVKYNLAAPYPHIKNFSLAIPSVDASKYSVLNFSIRGEEYGYPGIVKVVVKNRKNETAVYFAKDIFSKWKRFSIPLSEFEAITDWTNLKEISFVLEEWNIEKKKGMILIDDVSFSS